LVARGAGGWHHTRTFNAIGRLADAFGFFVPGPEAFEAGAKYLLARGYR